MVVSGEVWGVLVVLGCEAIGVAREHGGLADVVELEEEHHHPLQPNAATRVRVGSVLERVDVILDWLEINPETGTVGEQPGGGVRGAGGEVM